MWAWIIAQLNHAKNKVVSLHFLLQNSSNSYLFQGVKACILSNENKAFCNMVASVLVHPFPSQVPHRVPLFQQVSRGHFQPTMHPLRFEALLTGHTAQKSPDQPVLSCANFFNLLMLLVSY